MKDIDRASRDDISLVECNKGVGGCSCYTRVSHTPSWSYPDYIQKKCPFCAVYVWLMTRLIIYEAAASI